jgi:hypothetical protein
MTKSPKASYLGITTSAGSLRCGRIVPLAPLAARSIIMHISSIKLYISVMKKKRSESLHRVFQLLIPRL